MNEDNLHNKNKASNDSTEAFNRTKVVWNKSKDDIWKDTFESLKRDVEPKVMPLKRKPVFLYAAASIVLLIGLTGFLGFYTKSITCPSGEHLTTLLPDGSTVELNASSVLKFKPYTWMFSRKVQLEGEAFFKVKKGKAFVVGSYYGNTTVLGTSFNVFSRKETYEVTCVTGKVKVESSNLDQEVVLNPNYQATITNGGQIFVQKQANALHAVAWLNKDFVFTAVPIKRVFEELSRQYNVNITVPNTIDISYTGNFPKPKNIDEALELICQPLGIAYIRVNSEHFQITIN